MKTSLYVFAALIAAVLGITQTAQAQYGPGPMSPYGYPSPGMPPAMGQDSSAGMYPPGAMPGMGMPVGYGGPEVQAPLSAAQAPEQAMDVGGDSAYCDPGFGCNKWFAFGEFL